MPTPKDYISPTVLKRFGLILKLIELEDTADINEQINRLLKEDLDKTSIEIIELLKAGQYHEAVIKINNHITSKSSLTLYEDPEIGALQLEIKQLENLVINTGSEVAELEGIIAGFNHKMQMQVGNKIEELYKLKKTKAEKEKDNSEVAQEHFEETSRQYEEFKKDFAEQAKKEFFVLGDDEKEELKKMYRGSALLCHPDRFADGTIEDQKKAEEMFKELQQANEKQDLATIKIIYDKLQKGILNIDIKPQENVELLKIRVQELRIKLEELIAKLGSYKDSEALKIIEKYPDLTQYFADLESQLNKEIEILKEEVEIDEQ